MRLQKNAVDQVKRAMLITPAVAHAGASVCVGVMAPIYRDRSLTIGRAGAKFATGIDQKLAHINARMIELST
jgi:hypothetical protein